MGLAMFICSDNRIQGFDEFSLRIVGDSDNPMRESARREIIDNFKQRKEQAFREFLPIRDVYEAAKAAFDVKLAACSNDLKVANEEMNREYEEKRNDIVTEAHYAATKAILSQSLKTPFYATHIAATVVDAAKTTAGYAAAALALRDLAAVASDADACRAAADLFDTAAQRKRHHNS